MKKIRVLVADDHPLFREGLCQLLKNEKDVDCVATAANGEEAVKLAKELLPDVALIDVAMPGMNGIDAARQIKAACPNTAVLTISAYKYNYYALASIRAGVDGYLLKNTPRREVVDAIRMVHAGEGVFNLEVAGKVLRGLTADREKGRGGPSELRPREVEVFKLVAMGMSNKEIARELNISVHTVGTHLFNIFRKLGVESRTEATLYALKEGWVTIDDVGSKLEARPARYPT